MLFIVFRYCCELGHSPSTNVSDCLLTDGPPGSFWARHNATTSREPAVLVLDNGGGALTGCYLLIGAPVCHMQCTRARTVTANGARHSMCNAISMVDCLEIIITLINY